MLKQQTDVHLNSGILTLGLQYTSSQRGDTTLVISGPTEDLALSKFHETMSRYNIEGNEIWEFYGKPNFEGLLFTATGPVGWTMVDSKHNDQVSSVRPVSSECVQNILYLKVVNGEKCPV